jgi:hypothetical protein
MTPEEREAEVKKIATRIFFLLREMELVSLDLAQYAVPLSRGRFPPSWYKEKKDLLEKYLTEFQRISARYTEIFKEELETPDEPKPVVRRRRKK